MTTYTRFNLAAIMSGHILDVWSEEGFWATRLTRAIRWGEQCYVNEICDDLHVPRVPVFGNHNAIILGPDVPGVSRYCIGEALAEGSVITQLADYEAGLKAGTCRVRVFQPLPRFLGEDVLAVMRQAAVNWTLDVEDHGYGYTSYLGLIVRCLFGLDVPTELRGRFECAEGVQRAYTAYPPGYDIYQDDEAMPCMIEQAAGIIPGHKVCCREVTADVMG